MICQAQAEGRSKALQAHGAWNRRWEKVRDPLFAKGYFFDARDLVQVKYEMLRCVRENQASVADATRAFGFSRVRFYQIRRDFEAEGVAGLLPRPKGPRRAHKLTEEALAFLDRQIGAEPSISSGRLAQALRDRVGVRVHPRSIERALARRQKKTR